MYTLYIYYKAFVFIKKSKMLKAGQKCKHVQKTLGEKAEALNHIEKGSSNKEVAAKYNVSKNIISTLVKNKEKVLS